MTIWILALLLLGILAAVGYNQGAIRVGISLVGLITAALLAVPLAPLLKPVFPPFGLNNPLLVRALSPIIMFILILIPFKVIGLVVNRKVDVYYKYKAGDLRLGLWQRLSQRLGMCLGLVNGAIYLLLIALVIYPFSYLTTQMSTSDQDSKLVRLLNQAGRDLQATRLAKAVAAIDPVPAVYYEATDIIGLIYRNPLVHARLARYPTLMGLSERLEFQELANDRNFIEMLQRQAPLAEVVRHERAKSLLNNPQLQQEIWNLILPDLKDFSNFVATGKSPKYDREKILGRWAFDVNAAIGALKRARPNLTSVQLRFYRATIFPALVKMALVATPDKQAVLKNFVRIKLGVNPLQVSEPLTLRGQWQNSGSDGYRLTLEDRGTTENLEAVIAGDRMIISSAVVPLVLEREN